VALPGFKPGVPSEEGGRWVRFPCASAIFYRKTEKKRRKWKLLVGSRWAVSGKELDFQGLGHLDIRHKDVSPFEHKDLDASHGVFMPGIVPLEHCLAYGLALPIGFNKLSL